METGLPGSVSVRAWRVAEVLTLGAGLLWAYWSTLAEIAARWSEDPRYAHGYLVPAFSLALLWLRADRISGLWALPSWWGLPLLLAGAAMRLIGSYIYFEWLDAFSLVPCLAGLCLLVGGRKYLQWCWPSIGFLFFMIPLPYRLELALGGPLQRIATEASTFCLQTLGIAALSRGNVIGLSAHEIGIVEACSGLSMMVLFFAFSTAVAMLVKRSWIEKAIIVASAVPIALAVNVIRITTTGFLMETAGAKLAHVVYHDMAGWIMMPLALVFLGVEIKLLSCLFHE